MVSNFFCVVESSECGWLHDPDTTDRSIIITSHVDTNESNESK